MEDLIEKMELIHNSKTKLNVMNEIRYNEFSESFIDEITS